TRLALHLDKLPRASNTLQPAVDCEGAGLEGHIGPGQSQRLALAQPVRGELSDSAGALLDERDTLIADLDAAIADQNRARIVVADAELGMSITEANHTLGINGTNAETRKALLALALARDPA